MLGFHVGSPSDGLSPQARDMPITRKFRMQSDIRNNESKQIELSDVGLVTFLFEDVGCSFKMMFVLA